MPQISVVIVTWNARDSLVECLASLTGPATDGSITDRSVEVIVVDNASTDGTVAAVRDGTPWARVVANPTNRGLSAANNQGIAASRAPFVLLANPDVVFGPDTVTALAQAMDDHDRAAFTFARLVHPDGQVQTTAGDLPDLVDALLGRQVARWRHRGGRRDDRRGFWWDDWAHDQPTCIGHGLEACYLVRRDALADIGVQDERFWLDWEGIDWCATAAAHGWEAWFVPEAEAVHVGGVSLRQAPTRWIIETHRSMYRYFAKRSSPLVRPVLAVLFALRCGCKLAAQCAGATDYDRSHPGSGPMEPPP